MGKKTKKEKDKPNQGNLTNDEGEKREGGGLISRGKGDSPRKRGKKLKPK